MACEMVGPSPGNGLEVERLRMIHRKMGNMRASGRLKRLRVCVRLIDRFMRAARLWSVERGAKYWCLMNLTKADKSCILRYLWIGKHDYLWRVYFLVVS